MTTYSFKASSPASFSFTLFTSLMGGAILTGILSAYSILPKGDSIIFFIFFGGVILVTIYLIRLAAFAKIEVTLTENSVSVRWLQHFLFDSMPDAKIPFKEIAEYVNQDDFNWDWIKIKLKNQTVYRIWHSKLISKDDYSKFVSDFVYAVENYNEAIEMNVVEKNSAPNPSIIQKSKAFYETTAGLILGMITVVLLIAIPIILIVSPTKNTPNYGILIFCVIGAIYYVIKVYRSRLNRKDKSHSSTNA